MPRAGRVLLAVAAATTAAALGSPPTRAIAASVASVGSCPSRGHVVCLDRSDAGKTVHVRLGKTVSVRLGGSGLSWSGLHQVGPRLLRAKSPTGHGSGGLMATYTAVKAGRTALRASGAPECSPGKACPQFILLWQVQVVVG